MLMFDATSVLRRDDARISLRFVGINRTGNAKVVGRALAGALAGLAIGLALRFVLFATLGIFTGTAATTATLLAPTVAAAAAFTAFFAPTRGDSRFRLLGLSIARRTRPTVTTATGDDVHAYVGICRVTRVAAGPVMVYQSAIPVADENLDTLASRR